MLKIRLQRVGKRNNPAYRVILTDARRAPKSGGFLEILGSYNPQHKGLVMLKNEQISHWISKGAQVSDTVHNLLVREKVIDAPKRNVVAPSKLKKVVTAEDPKESEKQVPVEEAGEQNPTDVAKSETKAPEAKTEEKPVLVENKSTDSTSKDKELSAEEKPAEA
jgi:small subunit ribosomal protein S16